MATPVQPGGRVPATIEPSVARTILVEGVVQGVGFRPFVWRLATELGLAGRVRNAAGRVEVEAAGPAAALDAFARRLRTDAPPRARVERVTVVPLADELAVDLPAPGPDLAEHHAVAAVQPERLGPAALRELERVATERPRVLDGGAIGRLGLVPRLGEAEALAAGPAVRGDDLGNAEHGRYSRGVHGEGVDDPVGG